MKRYRYSSVCSLLFSSVLLSSSSSAVSYSNEDNPYLCRIDSGFYVIHGITDGFERDLEPRSNSYAAVGDDEAFVFILAYDWNRNNPERNCGFVDTGLYQNSGSHDIIYQIASPEYDSTSVISEDGNTVWIMLDSELPFGGSIPLDMSYPVIRKYSSGELQYSVSLNDIYSSTEDLFCWAEEDTRFYYNWCELDSVTPETLIFRDCMTNKQVYIDSQTGKATGLEKEVPDEHKEQASHVRAFQITAFILIIAIILLVCICIQRTHKKKNS